MGSADTMEGSPDPVVLTDEVNIRVLLTDPAVGLHPVLSCLPGWETVSLSSSAGYVWQIHCRSSHNFLTSRCLS